MHNTSFAIRLTNVSKRYTRYPGGYRLVSRIHHEKPTLVKKLINGSPPAGGEEFWVYPEKCEAFIPGAQRDQPDHQKRGAGKHHLILLSDNAY